MAVQLSDHFTYRKLFRFTLPSIAMMVFTSIYGVVDGYFISNFVGKTPFAAINLIMPFVMILGGMGFMIGTGGTALVSKVLGEGDKPQAQRYFSMMILFTLLSGGVLTLAGELLTPSMAVFLGATEAMLPDCILYARIVIGFTVCFMLQNLFHSFLIAAEKPRLGFYATVISGVTNMVLDYLFVGLFRWGVAGAAVATGLSQFVGSIIPLVYFIRPNSSLLRFRFARLELKPILKACGNGSSELMSNISSSLIGMLYNFQLIRFAGENGVSAYGVLMYILFIFVAVFVGYSVGSAPIVSFHYGAGNHGELKNMLHKSTLLMGIAGVVMTVLCYVLSAPLAKLYVGYDEELCQLTIHAFQLFSFSFILTGFNIYASSFFTALNNGKISALISFLRTLIFQAAAVLLLPLVLGVDGIWWAISVAELCAFLLSCFFLVRHRKTYHY